MKIRNNDIVLNHLRKNGTITSKEAIDLYGITRLAAVIFKLREDGKRIITTLQPVTDRYGRKTSVAVYKLLK